MIRRHQRLLFVMVPTLLAGASLTIFLVACGNNKTTVPGPGSIEAGPPAPTVKAGPAFFEDMTEKSGIKFMYRNGEETTHLAILESLGGGGALIDFDGDGKLDIFVCGGGFYDMDAPTYEPFRKKFEEARRADPKAMPEKWPKIHGYPCKLYRNKGNFEFEDVTEKVGLGKQPDLYTHGASVCDYDRDGWPDLLVTGYGRVILYHNEPNDQGGRKFVDVTRSAGLLGKEPDKFGKESGQPGDHFWGTSAAWGDLDGDGLPDLYICQYVDWSFFKNPQCNGYSSKIDRDVCPPKLFDSVPHALWKNNGNGTFTNITKEAGLRVQREDKDYGKGLGVLFIDVDGDGKPDIYVANDTTDNFLYLNRSTPGSFKFEDRGLALGVARDGYGSANGSMGVHAADYDGSGRPSIWVTNYENEYHALYRNIQTENRFSFTFNTPAAGLTAIGPSFVGFGTGFIDVDNDGWEDIVISNGHVVHYPPRDNLRQKQILFMNMEYQTGTGVQRRYADGSSRGGSFFQKNARGRGMAIGDLDNDGRADLVFFPLNEPVTILRNVAEGAHWLGVDLQTKDKRSVVGARLTLEVGDRKLVRFSMGGGSYLCAHDQRRIFGLGSATKVGKLKVEWPTGEPRVEEWENLDIDKYHTLVQGKR